MTNRDDRQSSTRPTQTTYLVEACASISLAGTTTREQVILEMHFCDGQDQAEIARQLAVSRQYVSKVLKNALAKLREANPDPPPSAESESQSGDLSFFARIAEGRRPVKKRPNARPKLRDQWELIALSTLGIQRLETEHYQDLDWCTSIEKRREHVERARQAREVDTACVSTPRVERRDTTEVDTWTQTQGKRSHCARSVAGRQSRMTLSASSTAAPGIASPTNNSTGSWRVPDSTIPA